MEALALEIVRSDDADDEKMAKIETWVRENIVYTPDIALYGRRDITYHPSVTVRKGRADCEDGALLTQALAAYAGIPLGRVRTVFTLHKPREGHAWNLYKRESDGEWIPVDWTWQESPSLDERWPVQETSPFVTWKFLGYYIVRSTGPFKRTIVRVNKIVPLAHFGEVSAWDRVLQYRE
jgi:transglutaminase-like putative cysteine protease